MQIQNSIDVHVGKCLRDMRFEIGWPVDRLAAATGVTTARMIEYESGEARMEARVMGEICRVLNVFPSTFFACLPEASSNGASTLDSLRQRNAEAPGAEAPRGAPRGVVKNA